MSAADAAIAQRLSPFRIRVFDKALVYRYGLGAVTISCTPRHQALGTADLTFPLDHPRIPDLFTPGRRVTIDYFTGDDYASEDVYYWPDEPSGQSWCRLMSGPLWSYDATSGSGDDDGSSPTWTWRVEDDRRWLSCMGARPTPGSALSSQTSAYDVRSGHFETVAKGYVTANLARIAAGDATHYAVPLTVAADLGTGPTVKLQARFDQLDALLGPAEVTSGQGMRITQQGTSLVFDVYTPTDRTARPLSVLSGAVRTFELQGQGPSLNAAVIGDGTGSGTSRVFTESEHGDSGKSYPLVEGFVDGSDTTDGTTLAQQVSAALTDGDPEVGLTVTVAETEDVTFGLNLSVSDLVAVELLPGIVFTETVSEATLTFDADNGLVVAPQIGMTAAALSPAFKLARELAAQRQQIGKLGKV